MSNIREINLPPQNLSTYDELTIAEATPFVAGSSIYGFIPSNFRTYLAGAGTATTNGNLFEVTSGTTIGDYGVIRSFRSINYKTGQGAVMRFSGKFVNSEALTWSAMGGFNIGDEFSFGYNGLDFGIWHRYGGIAEVQCLQITTGASGAENATVTVDGTAYVCPITSGSVQLNAHEISEYLKANGEGFNVEQVDDCVYIDFTSDGDKTGTFSMSSSTAVGSFSQTTAGVTKTSDHIMKADWNGVDLSTLDPSKGNTYQITYQNGFGNAHFFIEHPETGHMVEVHTLKWNNENTATNLTNPALRIGCYCYSIGATSAVTVNMAYCAGFITGRIADTRNPRSVSNTKNIGTTATNILTLRNSYTYNGHSNQVEIEPLYLTIANDGGKTAVFELRSNPTVAGITNFQQIGTNLISQLDVDGTTVTENGRLLGSFVVAKGQTASINLKEFAIRLPPSLNLVIDGKMTSGASADLTASIVWYEDV